MENLGYEKSVSTKKLDKSASIWKAIKQHYWIWYLWDPLLLFTYGIEIIETTKSNNFPSTESVRESEISLYVILICDIIEVIFNFFRARSKDQTLRETSIAYLKCLLWVDILAIIPFDRISFILFIFKVGKIRQMFRACSTIEHMVYKMAYNFPYRSDKNAANFTVGRSYGKFANIFVFAILGTFVLSMVIITFRFDFIFTETNINEGFSSVFIASVVYFITTITSVGYGDITI